jgi:hypothetical protein
MAAFAKGWLREYKSLPPGHIAVQPTNVRFRGANRTLSGHPPKAESDPNRSFEAFTRLAYRPFGH